MCPFCETVQTPVQTSECAPPVPASHGGVVRSLVDPFRVLTRNSARACPSGRVALPEEPRSDRGHARSTGTTSSTSASSLIRSQGTLPSLIRSQGKLPCSHCEMAPSGTSRASAVHRCTLIRRCGGTTPPARHRPRVLTGVRRLVQRPTSAGSYRGSGSVGDAHARECALGGLDAAGLKAKGAPRGAAGRSLPRRRHAPGRIHYLVTRRALLERSSSEPCVTPAVLTFSHRALRHSA